MIKFKKFKIAELRKGRLADGEPMEDGKKSMTQSDLAKLMGVTTATVWNWENGFVKIGVDVLGKLASTFKVEVGIFYD